MFQIFLVLLSIAWSQAKPAISANETEKLIVFLQTDKDLAFIEQSLPQIKNYCKNNAIQIVVKEAEAGLPQEITSTPAIVFQTENKRLFYAGRYQQFSSIKNFIRTGRFREPSQAAFCKESVWLKQEGRTQLMAVAKITDLKGTLPQDYDAKRFAKQAIDGISQGLAQYPYKDEACISQTDRVFYLDFHPYRADNGQLYLSLELYSQFSCVEPIYTANSMLVAGENWLPVFAKGSEEMAQQIEKTLAQSQIGDALSSVPLTVNASSWESLGLAFPEGAEKPVLKANSLKQLKGDWQYVGAPDPRIPALSFHFQEPLERYAGEVSQLEGELSFDENDHLIGGKFFVDVSSLSMGMADLDEKVLRKYLKAKKYPLASFEFDLSAEPLTLAQEQQILAIPGTFSLMNEAIELPIQTQFQMIADDAGKAQLWVNGQFSLNITQDFGIEGPDGPSPNRESMIFYFSILLNSQN